MEITTRQFVEFKDGDYFISGSQVLRVAAVNRRDLLDWPPLFRQGGVTPTTFFPYLHPPHSILFCGGFR